MYRLFIDANLPSEILQALRETQTQLQRRLVGAPLSWTRPEGIHITLKFLGDTDPGRVEAITAALRQAVTPHHAFTVTVGGFGCFPNPRKANVLWVGVQDADGRLARLAASIDQATAALGWELEHRPFTAHLTLARVHRDAAAGQRRVLGEILPTISLPSQLGTAPIERIHLIRSELNPQGSAYTALAGVELAGKS